MLIKDFLYKLKVDLKALWGYPVHDFKHGYEVNYDAYWRKRRKGSEPVLSDWQKQRADFILDMIEPSASVLDLGSGDGAVLRYLNEKGQIKGIGVDVSDDMIKRAKQIGVEVLKLDISNLDNLDNLPEVDYILGLEMIEHMPIPEAFVQKIKKKARKAMIFSIPNTGYYGHRLRLLFGRFPLQWVVHPGEHLRFWTATDIVLWVKAMGLHLNKLILYEGLPVLNKLFPKLFAKGIIVKISSNK